MPSTYTSRLRLVKPTTGELTNTWGDVFNAQFSDLIDAAIAGYLTVDMSDADTTLTSANGAGDQSRSAMLKFTGTLTANREIIVPTSNKLYFMENATDGGFTLTVKTSAGTGVDILSTHKALVACDGTNVIFPLAALPDEATIGEYVAGYRDIPQNSQSADYTLVAADAGKHIYHPSADTTLRTWTIPDNGTVPFRIGTAVTFINDASAGSILLTIDSPDVLTFAENGSTGTRTISPNGVCTAVKVAATRWMLSGTNVT
jgi:hypothetical protein